MAAKALELEVEGPDGPRTVRVSSPEKVHFAELGVTKSVQPSKAREDS